MARELEGMSDVALGHRGEWWQSWRHLSPYPANDRIELHTTYVYKFLVEWGRVLNLCHILLCSLVLTFLLFSPQ